MKRFAVEYSIFFYEQPYVEKMSDARKHGETEVLYRAKGERFKVRSLGYMEKPRGRESLWIMKSEEDVEKAIKRRRRGPWVRKRKVELIWSKKEEG